MAEFQTKLTGVGGPPQMWVPHSTCWGCWARHRHPVSASYCLSLLPSPRGFCWVLCHTTRWGAKAPMRTISLRRLFCAGPTTPMKTISLSPLLCAVPRGHRTWFGASDIHFMTSGKRPVNLHCFSSPVSRETNAWEEPARQLKDLCSWRSAPSNRGFPDRSKATLAGF